MASLGDPTSSEQRCHSEFVRGLSGALGEPKHVRGTRSVGAALRAIPYYAWDNRRPADAAEDWMVVWLKQAEIHRLRQSLKDDDYADWDHRFYRPLLT